MVTEIIMPRVFIFLLVVVLLLPHLLYFSAAAVDGYICDHNGNFTGTAAYKANLDALLSTLPTNIDRYGFYNASAGRPPDRVSATALCRADIPLADCRQCLRDAVTNLTGGVCHYQKQAVLWYRDSTCTLRYSNNDRIFGELEVSPKLCTGNAVNTTNPTDFKDNLRRLLADLRTQALRVGARRKYAAGSRSGTDLQTIYALVQCSPDLKASDCNDCLSGAGADIPNCCGDSRGCRNLKPSCNLRYETYPFFSQVNDVEVAPGAAPAQPQQPPSPIPVVQSPTGKKDLNKNRTIVITVVSIAASCLVLAAALIGIFLRHKPVKRLEALGENESSSIEALQYSFITIKAATNDFSDDNKLGRGGFGVVYKGILPNGQEIAVKRLLHNSSQGSLEFKTEVLLLAKLLHRNLVKLLGFCLEGTEKLLVYEYVPNGSLDRFIFGRIDKSHLDWDVRMKIIWGIAKGLLYLHEDSQLKVIHRDLKASNVLLDHRMVPKIADFGLAKMFEQDETHGNTSKIAGTFGYMPPEYVRRGQFSVKSDVFSFGVLVLEIISGMKNSGTSSDEESDMNLLDFVWKNWNDETYANIVDPSIRPSSNNLTSDMLRCIQIGLSCVEENAVNRPTMASVVLMLSSFSVSMKTPSQPAFVYGSRQHQTSSSLEDGSSSEGHKIPPHSGERVSINDVSITELTPR